MPRRMGLYEDYSLLCICAVDSDNNVDFRAGLYCASDFAHCGSDRACVITGLRRQWDVYIRMDSILCKQSVEPVYAVFAR